MAGSQGPWIVDFDEGAVRDYEAVKSKDERKAVFTVVDKLRQLGPRLPAPHIKPLKGEPGLSELRPRQGSSKARPIVIRERDRFVVIAVAPDHAKDMSRAISDAHTRVKSRQG